MPKIRTRSKAVPTTRQVAGLDLSEDRSAQAVADALAGPLSDAYLGQFTTAARPAASALSGKIIWDTDLTSFYKSDGTNWAAVSLGSGGASTPADSDPQRGSTTWAALSIPTPDGNPSVGHPSILKFASPWNGYRYWMGFTPYPAEVRENACIVASHDGVNWVVPTGVTNPITPNSRAGALGLSYWSDTEIVMLDGTNTTMGLYYRGYNSSTGANKLYRKTSTNGTTWGNETEVLTSATDSLISPTIVRESDGTFTMWCVDDPNWKITRRTSADGVTWSAPTDITVNDFTFGSSYPRPWHLSIKKLGSTYWMLLTSKPVTPNGSNPPRLNWLKSADGITWDYVSPFIPKSGHAWDAGGHYRSTFLASGNKLDVYVTGIDASNSNVFAADWRIGLVRGVDPFNAAKPTAMAVNTLVQGAWKGVGTAATSSVYSGVHPSWQFTNAADSSIATTVPLPGDVTRYRVDIAVAATTAGSAFTFELASFSYVGTTIGATTTTQQVVTVNGLNWVTLGYFTVDPVLDNFRNLKITRKVNDAGDTATIDAHLVLARLVPMR